MQFTYSALAVVALSSLAAAQISAIPSCAQPCILSAIAQTSCGATDTACQCEPANMAAIQAGATGCVEKACTAAEIVQTLAATTNLCKAGSSGSSSSSSASAPPSSSSSSAASSSAPPTSSTPAPSSSAPATLATTASSTSTQMTSATAASNGTATPTVVQFTGAGSQLAATFGSVFAVGVAVLAAF